MDARKPQDGPREDRFRPNQEGGAPRRDFDDENRRGRGGRGGGRGMGRGRGGGEGGMRREGGGGGNRDGAFRGKREFERKSGDGRTGVKAEEKRGGGGKGNWGTIEDELKGVSFVLILLLFCAAILRVCKYIEYLQPMDIYIEQFKGGVIFLFGRFLCGDTLSTNSS